METKESGESFIAYRSGLVDFCSFDVSPADLTQLEHAFEMAADLCESGLLKNLIICNEITYLVFPITKKKLWYRLTVQYEIDVNSDFVFVLQRIGKVS